MSGAVYAKKIDEQLTPWEEQLVAWAGLCSGNNENGGGKRRNAHPHGLQVPARNDRRVRSRCCPDQGGCQFEAHPTAPSRPGAATSPPSSPARNKLLRIICVVLKTGRPYYDRTDDYEALMVKRNAPRWICMLRLHGCIEPVDAQLQAA